MSDLNGLSPISVGIIGAGVSGMAAGLCMQRRGVPFTIFEKADEVGGTWRENRYPGLTIDVPSAIYTFASERNPHWRNLLPDQAEILDYHRQVSHRTGLRDRIRFGSEVTSATWNGSEWELRTADGHSDRFRVLICAQGFLHHPRWPQIDGLDAFTGELVHSACWRDEVELDGRRVGVVGCGSTGVQLVSAIAGRASKLSHFQRTPQWIFPLPNVPLPKPARQLLAHVPGLIDAVATGVEWGGDWILGGAAIHAGLRRRLLEGAARLNLMTVRDAELRRKLTPGDSALCKRPVVSTSFYRAVQRDDVEVVVEAIDRIEPDGVRTADGSLHELDVLIMATGFHAHDYMRPIAVTGEGGTTLQEAWARGPYGYRTMAIPSFPNLFMLMGPHSPLLSFPIHTSAELQSEYVGQVIDILERDRLVSLAPSAEAAERWLAEIRAGMTGTVWASGCSSWYLGDGDTPVIWPYDRRRWRETLRVPILSDYEVRAVEAVIGAI